MSRDQWLILVSVVIPVALIAWGMAAGWRARRRRQGDVTALAGVPVELGLVRFDEDLLYVATTRADAPLDRIAVEGLGFRARAGLVVADAGIVLTLAGAQPGFIPAAEVRGVGRATWTIDRVVGGDGLVFVRWAQEAGAVLDGYVRSADPAALVAAVETLIPNPKEAAA